MGRCAQEVDVEERLATRLAAGAHPGDFQGGQACPRWDVGRHVRGRAPRHGHRGPPSPPSRARIEHHVIGSCHALGVQDPDGHPMKYDQMSVFESIVAKQHVRIEIDVPGEGGRGWRRSASSIELDSQQDLGEAWRRDLQAGTAYMLQETLVKSNDAHMDAKVVRDSLKWNAPPGSARPLGHMCSARARFGHACTPTALVRYTQNRAAAACRGTPATALPTSNRSSGGATLSQISAAPCFH